MKILGLNPKDFYSGWPVQSDFGRELYRSPALTFPVLKRLLPPGHEMRFLEGFFEPITMKDYMELIRWPDVVGFNIASSYGAISYAVAIQQVRRINPKAFIIAGGHHANMYAERWLDMGVDLIVKGEAELMFTRLVEEIAGKRRFDLVPGVAFKRDGEYVETEPPPQIETLDDSPFPDFGLINYKIYPCKIDTGGGYVGSLECSRGCSFRCKFCAVPAYWKGTQRYKSVSRVVREVEELKKHRVRQINILDDGFGNDLDYTEELADALKRFADDLSWVAFLRTDTALQRPELIDRLAAAGMKATLLGYESLNEEVLKDYMSKGLKVRPVVKDYQEMYRRFRRNNIMVVGVFISGHPGITEEKETPYMVARTVCDDPRLADYMPFPGTAGYNELVKETRIKDMFFHDVKLQIFPWRNIEAFRFNLLNILDLPRQFRMIAGPTHYRNYILVTQQQLWTKILRINRHKIRDYMLMRRKDLTSDEKQERLMSFYLEDPDYSKWLDSLTDKVWF